MVADGWHAAWTARDPHRTGTCLAGLLAILGLRSYNQSARRPLDSPHAPPLRRARRCSLGQPATARFYPRVAARCRTLGEGITEPQSRSVHSTLRQNTTTLSTAPNDNDAEERKMLQESKQGERTVFNVQVAVISWINCRSPSPACSEITINRNVRREKSKTDAPLE